MSSLMASIAEKEGKPEPAHHDLDLLADLGKIPPHLDKRAKKGLGSSQDVLAWGEKLGAVKLVP